MLTIALLILLAVTVFRVLHPPREHDEAKKSPTAGDDCGAGGYDTSGTEVHLGNNSTLLLI